jgi:hypothetical protein
VMLTGRRWFEFWLFRVLSRVPSRAYFVWVMCCKACCADFDGSAYVGFVGDVWVDYMGCLLGVALGCFSWFVWVWVLLLSLGLFLSAFRRS